MPQLPPHDPLAVLATAEQIKAVRNELEVAQVVVAGTLVDFDERAEKRMQDAVEQWDYIGETTLDWTMGDNVVVPLTKTDVTNLLAACKQVRALRGLALHTTARTLKADPTTTLRDLENWKTTVLG